MRGEIAPGALAQVLARVCRERRTGWLRLDRAGECVRLFFGEGGIADVDSRVHERPGPDPDDSASLQLHQVLEGLGIRQRRPAPTPGRRQRLLAALSWREGSSAFDDEAAPPPSSPGLGLSTVALIAEAVRRIGHPGQVRAALGDLGRVVAKGVDPAAGEPLTAGESELVRRVDGTLSVGELLAGTTAPPEEAERSLLGLLLRGLVTDRPSAEPAPAPAPAPDPESLGRRREIQAAMAGLSHKSHFEVLGLPVVTSPAGIEEAYRRLSRRFDATICAHPSLHDLSVDLEALRLRIEGAYNVLRRPESRAAYEAELRRRRTREAEEPAPESRPVPKAAEKDPLVEERLQEAEHMLTREQWWDAVQVLQALPPTLPRRQKRRAQILLARAYCSNPKWGKRAVELLQAVVREDPGSTDAYLLLARLYKARGLQSRAAAMFRKVLELEPGHKAAALEAAPGPPLLQRLLGRH